MHLARRAASQSQKNVGIVSAKLPAAQGAEEMFADMYRRLHDRMLQDATWFLEYEDARDAIHDAALQLWDRRLELQPEQWTEAYFMAAAHNHVMNYFRGQRPDVELTDELETSADFPRVPSVDEEGNVDVGEVLDRIVRAMPPRCREVFALVREHHMTHEQVAAQLGIGVRTSWKHMVRAKELLRKGLSAHGWRLGDGTVQKLLAEKSSEATHD